MASVWSRIRSFVSGLRQQPDLFDAFWFTLLAILLFYAAVELDLFDCIVETAPLFDFLHIKNVLLGLAIFGLFALVYAYRRYAELKVEILRRREAEDSASWHAQHDVLTQLRNRSFAEKLIHDFEKSRLLAPSTARHVSFGINLNGFKRVNDLLGHRAGDELLIVVAERLEQLFPGKIVARTGGDEFLVFAEISDHFDVEQSASSLLQTIRQPIFIGSTHTQIGASVGYAVYPDQVANLGDIVRFSDIAMNEARRAGKNVIRKFREGMDESLARNAVVEMTLREAIRNNIIVPFFQPLVDLQTGSVCGFEALARWRMDDGAFAEPSAFIQLAEDAGLLVDLSERLLRQACQAALGWPPHVVLAFNISPTQLTDRNLGLRILKILEETGLSPDRLELEITETALVSEQDTASVVLNTLHDAGIRIALDDFGTGYSSLSQLSRFPFSKIKIDKSFIRTFRKDEKQMKIVKTILGLGQGLGVTVTAEGIEYPAEASSLKSLGCDFGQGYFFGQAVPAGAALDLLSHGTRPFRDVPSTGRHV